MTIDGIGGSFFTLADSAPTKTREPTYFSGPADPDGSDGPPLDAGLLEAGFVPQGQGYDGENTLVTTYNNGSEVRLTLQDRYTGDQSGIVTLGGREPPKPPSTEGMSPQAARVASELHDLDVSRMDLSPPDKGGGVAIDGEFIYVADTEAVYVYRRADVERAQRSGAEVEVPAERKIPMPDGVRASYLTVHEGKLYVGEYQDERDFHMLSLLGRAYGSDTDLPGPIEVESTKEQLGDFWDAHTPDLDSGVDGFLEDAGSDVFGKLDTLVPFKGEDDAGEPGPAPEYQQAQLHTFTLDPTTASGLAEDGDNALVYDSIDIPQATQGVVVTDKGFLFTRSYSDAPVLSPRELVFQPFDGEAREIATIDYYAEGVSIVGDEVWITYESAAGEYQGKDGRHNVQRIPLDSLDISRDDLGA